MEKQCGRCKKYRNNINAKKMSIRSVSLRVNEALMHSALRQGCPDSKERDNVAHENTFQVGFNMPTASSSLVTAFLLLSEVFTKYNPYRHLWERSMHPRDSPGR